MPTAKPTNQPAVLAALSASRLSTYPAVTDWHLGDALQLYGWNARVSAALMLPAHFAEVTTRNAVDEALTAVYGPSWPWDPSLERSVPNPPAAYNPRKDLQLTRIRHATTGKVIAEFKFVFWQKMFTARHDTRVWNHQILALFPSAAGTEPAELRGRIYGDLEAIRLLRNRLAHHEPVFARDLTSDLAKILDLISLRSSNTAVWVRAMEEATDLLSESPLGDSTSAT